MSFQSSITTSSPLNLSSPFVTFLPTADPFNPSSYSILIVLPSLHFPSLMLPRPLHVTHTSSSFLFLSFPFLSLLVLHLLLSLILSPFLNHPILLSYTSELLLVPLFPLLSPSFPPSSFPPLISSPFFTFLRLSILGSSPSSSFLSNIPHIYLSSFHPSFRLLPSSFFFLISTSLSNHLFSHLPPLCSQLWELLLKAWQCPRSPRSVCVCERDLPTSPTVFQRFCEGETDIPNSKWCAAFIIVKDFVQ